MKVLKYGKDYIHTIRCDRCSSELEYEPSDTFGVKRSHLKMDEFQLCIMCPVCNHIIITKREFIERSIWDAPQPKKKTWFERWFRL